MGFGFNNHLGSRFGFNAGGLSNYSGQSFSIAKSFYFDGLAQYFSIPQADLSTYLSGSGKSFSINFLIKPFLGAVDYLFANNDFSFAIRVDASNKLQFIGRDGAFLSALSNESLTNGVWQFVTVTYNSSLTLGNRVEIYVNGTILTKSIDTLDANIDSPTLDYQIGAKNSTEGFYGYINSFSVLDIALSQSQITQLYNNGKPKDPQQLFGVNCVYNFNPDNSGDTSPFTVTNQGITATSINMTDANKTPITPYADPIADLVTKYGFLNAWSGENIEINGTTTKAKDYVLEHDLANPTVASQPTFKGANSSFGNRPILDFDGIDDYLTKSVANWRASDSSGIFIMVANVVGNYYFSTNDNSSNTAWFSMYQGVANIHGFVKSGALVVSSNNSYTGANVYASVGTGTEFKEFINGLDETNSPASYSWLDSLPTQRDDIVLGSTQRLSSIYANVDIAFCGYLPYTDDATIIACQNELKTIFGI